MELFGGGVEHFPGCAHQPITDPSLLWINVWWNRESLVTMPNHLSYYDARKINDEPGMKWRKHAGFARCGIRLIFTDPTHISILVRRRPQWRRISLTAQKYCFGIYPVAGPRLPTTFQNLPYIVRELFPFLTLGPAGAFATQDHGNDVNDITRGKWYPPAENFVYHHS
jgi:hypothetical protein